MMLLAGLALLLMPATEVAAQEPEVSVRLGGRAQFQFNTTSVGEEDLAPSDEAPAASTFETRRVRLRVDIGVDDWIRARIQPDVAQGSLRLADAWVDFELSDYLNLKVGQFKRSFSLLELTSSTVFPVIERGARIRGLDDAVGAVGEHQTVLGESGYVGRDIGASVRGGTDRFGWELGLFNGEGADSRDVNDDKTIASRFTVVPSAGDPLRVGAGLTRRDTDLEDGWAFEADAEWGRFRDQGLHVLAEVAFGDDLTSTADDSFSGFQGIVSWFEPVEGRRFDGVEVAGRVSWADPNDAIEDDEGILLTPGVNLYVFGRNRIMANWDFYLPSAGALDAQNAFRAQAQVYF
jgi:hypothetical protein